MKKILAFIAFSIPATLGCAQPDPVWNITGPLEDTIGIYIYIGAMLFCYFVARGYNFKQKINESGKLSQWQRIYRLLHCIVICTIFSLALSAVLYPVNRDQAYNVNAFLRFMLIVVPPAAFGIIRGFNDPAPKGRNKPGAHEWWLRLSLKNRGDERAK